MNRRLISISKKIMAALLVLGVFGTTDAGGIEVCIAAERPEGIPAERWLPIDRKDADLSPQPLVYIRDLSKMNSRTASKAETIEAEAGEETTKVGGPIEVLQDWQGDFPVAQLDKLPEGQRDRSVGFIDDAKTFENVWKAFKPGENLPAVDFKVNLVLFARNTQYYNRIRIGSVNLKEGVAEVLAMETLSAAPIQDKVAMSLVAVPRQGISGIQAGDAVIPVKGSQ